MSIQCFDGDGKDPDGTGEWDAIDLANIEYVHRLDKTTPEDWAAVGKDMNTAMGYVDGVFGVNKNIAVGALGRLAAIGVTKTQQEAMDVIHGRTEPARAIARARLDEAMERLREAAQRLGRRS